MRAKGGIERNGVIPPYFHTCKIPLLSSWSTSCLPNAFGSRLMMQKVPRGVLCCQTDIEKVRKEKIRDGEDQKGRQAEERRCMCAKR